MAQRREVGGGRFFEAEVEVEGAAGAPRGKGGEAGGGLSETGEVEGRGGVGSEEVGLFDGLRSPGLAVGKGAVSGEGDEGKALIVGFDEGREELCGGGSGGGDHGDGLFMGENAAEGEVGGGAFFKVVPKTQAGHGGEEDEEGAVASPGADDKFAHAGVGDQGLKSQGGEVDLGWRREVRHEAEGGERRGGPSCV